MVDISIDHDPIKLQNELKINRIKVLITDDKSFLSMGSKKFDRCESASEKEKTCFWQRLVLATVCFRKGRCVGGRRGWVGRSRKVRK